MTSGSIEKQQAEKADRRALLRNVPKRGKLAFIPGRLLTPQERAAQLLLVTTEKTYEDGGDVSAFTDSLKALAAQPIAGRNPPAERGESLDRHRFRVTIVMVLALFGIVAVIVVTKPNASSGIFQLVSLASGLAGIGLGWLFGAAASGNPAP
jgi:hypothetical protein